MSEPRRHERVRTDIGGFDAVVDGGLPAGRLYVVGGPPGSGRTTVSSQFVASEAKQVKSCLYVSTRETEADIRQDVAGFGFDSGRGLDSGRSAPDGCDATALPEFLPGE